MTGEMPLRTWHVDKADITPAGHMYFTVIDPMGSEWDVQVTPHHGWYIKSAVGITSQGVPQEHILFAVLRYLGERAFTRKAES